MALGLDELRKLLEEAGVHPDLARSIDPAVPLLKQGLDSMDFPSFCALLEERYGVALEEDEALKLRTLNDFAAYLEKKA